MIGSPWALVLSLIAGMCVGTVFFEGLWWTVSVAVLRARPMALLVLSFMLRAALLLSALCLVSHGDILRLGTFMLGFWVSRIVLLRIHRGEKLVAD